MMKYKFGLVVGMSILMLAGCGREVTILTGPAGATGVAGRDGVDGIDGQEGAQGATGATGASGQDATPTTIIQLCPGAPSYPAVFIEVAICLQGKLYGVYSANGGFLTYLPPGNYSSNAIGSACSFTVGANCQVTH